MFHFSVLAPQSLFCFFKNKTPGQLIIQYTDLCNANCPQCGMRLSNHFTRSTLDKNKVKNIIRAASKKGIQVISFTGGEPFLYLDDILEISEFAQSQGIPFLRTGTNGYVFMNHTAYDFKDKIKKMAEHLSKSGLRNIWISIDSADKTTHEKMRGLPGVIQGIEKALPILHEYNIYPAANLGINRNISGNYIESIKDPDNFYHLFVNGFKSFYDFIIHLGFTMANTCYPMSIETTEENLQATYQATSPDLIVKFTKKEKIQIFKALMHVIPLYRKKIRIFTPMVSLLSLIRQCEDAEEKAYPCRGGIDYFFINAVDGNTYPCGYRGKENLGNLESLDLKHLKQTSCRLCDWECFRDPSELLGNGLELCHNPIQLFKKYNNDSAYFNALLNDLKYYKACDFFNGRKPINMKKLKRFSHK